MRTRGSRLVGEAGYPHETHGGRLVLDDRQERVALVGLADCGIYLGQPPTVPPGPFLPDRAAEPAYHA